MSQPVNALRGESTIEIAGHSYVLRPSFEALVAAEDDVGSLFSLVERASQGKLRIGEMTALIWHCLPAEARPPREVVGQQLLTVGLVEASKPVRAIFAQVLKGQT